MPSIMVAYFCITDIKTMQYNVQMFKTITTAGQLGASLNDIIKLKSTVWNKNLEQLIHKLSCSHFVFKCQDFHFHRNRGQSEHI